MFKESGHGEKSVQVPSHDNLAQIIKLILINPPFITMRYGIHGRAHANRVLLFANMLSAMLQADEDIDLRVITIAALLHDSGRKNDGKDPLHGNRSAEITSRFIETHHIDCNKELIIKTIQYHCESDTFTWTHPALEAKIVSDADKLDRFRFKRENPLNIDLLKLPESHGLIDIASRINGHPFRSFKYSG